MIGGLGNSEDKVVSSFWNENGISDDFLCEIASSPRYIFKWIETQNNFIGVWNKKGHLVYISECVQQLFGFHPADLKGTGWYNFIPMDDFISIKDKIHNKTGHEKFNINVYNSKKELSQLECMFGEVFDKLNRSYYLGIFNKINISNDTREKIVLSEKMNVAGQLAAGIAHEIRNPLTSLKGFLQLLQGGISQKNIYYKIMSDELDKIETITSELLFISKPLTNKRSIESIQSMISDVMILLNSHAYIRNINVIWNEEYDCHLYCDRSQIKQVLINIIKNAIEATKESGTIKIDVRSNDSKIEIDVIDEGPGVGEDLIHKIGEPFFTTKENGTGLGLMVTKHILNQYGGKLDIFNNAEKGSTFRIILPIEGG